MLAAHHESGKGIVAQSRRLGDPTSSRSVIWTGWVRRRPSDRRIC